MNSSKLDMSLVHDASATWSGFNYQGKVAIYVVLYLINNQHLLEKTELNSWQDYELELEYLEDFSIKVNGNYFTIHQVKAYKNGHLISKYSDAIWALIEKLMSKPIIEKACLHTLVQVEKLKNNSIDVIKNLNPSKQKLKEFKEEHIESEEIIEIIDKLSFYNLHSKYSLFCSLDNLESLIKEEIKTYYENNENEYYQGDKCYLKKVYHHILGKIDNHIIAGHNQIIQENPEDRTPISIPFSEIVELLEKDYNEVGESYLIYCMKNNINKYVSDFCEEACLKEQKDFCSKCFLQCYITEVNMLDNDDYFRFVKNINPHKVLEDNLSIMNYTRFVQAQEYKGSFFEILQEIEKYVSIKKNKIIYIGKVNQRKMKYLPTTIRHTYSRDPSGRKKEKEIKKIARKILSENSEVIEDLYEIDNMISLDVNVERLGSKLNDVSKISEDQNKKIKETKNIGITDVDSAKEVLNNE